MIKNKKRITALGVVFVATCITLLSPKEAVVIDYEESPNAIVSNQINTIPIDGFIEFNNDETWESHFEKHKDEFEFSNKEEYLQGANDMLIQSDLLIKKDDDNDDLYYREITNEFAVVSTDGYLRTYFKPDDGIEYFNRK